MKKDLHIILFLILGILLSGNGFSQDTVVCAGDFGTYAVASTYSYSSVFDWNVEGGEIQNNYGNKIEVKWADNTDEGRITVMERGLGGCEGELKEYVVDVRSAFADLGLDEEICEGQSVTFSPGSDYTSYQWQDGSGQSYYVADSTGDYWVTVNDEYGCVDTDSVHLTVHDKPDVNIEVISSFSNKIQVSDDSVSFMVDEVDYITLDAGMWSAYEWNTGEMSPSIEVEDNDIAQPTSGAKTKDYWVTVTNEYGCINADTIAVTVVGGLKIPNAFTPNDDQANNYWKIPGLALYPNCEVEIYDRWGKMIYQSKGYDEADYWDGTTQNGKKMPMDSYYYIIRLGNGDKPIYGTVTIIR